MVIVQRFADFLDSVEGFKAVEYGQYGQHVHVALMYTVVVKIEVTLGTAQAKQTFIQVYCIVGIWKYI